MPFPSYTFEEAPRTGGPGPQLWKGRARLELEREGKLFVEVGEGDVCLWLCGPPRGLTFDPIHTQGGGDGREQEGAAQAPGGLPRGPPLPQPRAFTSCVYTCPEKKRNDP